MSLQFDHVSVLKKSNVYFGGTCISHTVQFEDGTKKTLGVILPTPQALIFETHVPERMEIISGECRVQIADNPEGELFRAGQSFYVPGNSRFKLETADVLDYVCHYEG
jgi:purine/pyrimidine-nucleoside phosphorylase